MKSWQMGGATADYNRGESFLFTDDGRNNMPWWTTSWDQDGQGGWRRHSLPTAPAEAIDERARERLFAAAAARAPLLVWWRNKYYSQGPVLSVALARSSSPAAKQRVARQFTRPVVPIPSWPHRMDCDINVRAKQDRNNPLDYQEEEKTSCRR